ncbi:hypothetical protein HYFRA_00007725 [Hymenoscyphus fraxineus]|uniref:Small EDRK-rich factor-like N-terminal domain-containing protein n=2 Tax=Hymenoscyphus TaxID=5182 RepID=A0A9N9KKS5_9HELO|nr:hypothetical protein HYFRA_00007725 [Hymenoscyphus fraxineus]
MDGHLQARASDLVVSDEFYFWLLRELSQPPSTIRFLPCHAGQLFPIHFSKNCGHITHHHVKMARGNQRDKAREANQKKLADQKKGNTMTGSEMQREKEKVAQKMREKQAAADAKKAAEAAAKVKK